MLQFHPANPFRVVGWRWHLAKAIREKKRRGGPGRDDEYVLCALDFQRRLDRCRDDVDKWELMDETPQLYAAYLIHNNGANEDRNPLRYAVEARLLADQSFADIDEITGTMSGTTEIYEKIFFNVKDKLNRTDYVVNCVIGPSVHAGLTDRDYDLLWKLFGYLYGPIVLDSFISTSLRRFKPDSAVSVNALLADDARSSIQRKVAIVARTFTVNPFSQSELLNLYARMLEMEKATDGAKSHDVILQNVQIALDSLPYRVGDTYATNKTRTPLLEHLDNSAAELRTEELINITSGKTLELAELEEVKFPPPGGINGKKND